MEESRFSKKSLGKRDGFALILTLALISFVFLLVITLVNQVRLEMSLTEARQNQILAKAYARMGMMIAIGEIQKHLGPDMRVSAIADIYDERIESEHSYKTAGYPLNSSSTEKVDLYEREDNQIELGQRQWTGVWKHRGGWAETQLPTLPLPENRDDGKALTKSWSYDSSYDPHPAIEQAWLVSGNEGWKRKLAIMGVGKVDEFIEVPDGIIRDDDDARGLNNPRGGTYGIEENPWDDHKEVVKILESRDSYHHPLIALPDPADLGNPDGSDQTVWLLKNPLLNNEYNPSNLFHQRNWKNYLVTEPVKVQKTAVHSADSVLDSEGGRVWREREGSYGYWVGDEGVKAKVNIVEPYRVEDNGEITNLLTDENKLKVATSPNLEAFSLNYESKSLSSVDKRKDLITAPSGSYLLATQDLPERPENIHYHSLTTDSFGLLADLRTGGLKRDLSQIFDLNETSVAWKKDFDENFIYRDRVRAMKNFPLLGGAAPNEWYVSANNPTVDDPNALLAGPPWSVLADYHKLSSSGELLTISGPDQFPRVNGDNALIFGRFAPSGKSNALPDARSAYPFYNCFSSAVRKIRPEPKNHPVLPVVTSFKFSICPVAQPISGSASKGLFSLALNPQVTLWNPYNKRMLLEDLFIKVPFKSSHGDQAKISSDFVSLDIKEYDLYRKWWAYLYDSNATEPFDKSKTNSELETGHIMELKDPWGLFTFKKGEIQLTDKNTGKFAIRETGFFDIFREDSESLTRSFLPKYVDKDNWDNRIPPDSYYGKKMEAGTIDTIIHENPRAGGHEFSFKFNTMRKGSLEVDKIFLQIKNLPDELNATLEPGEVATFAVFDAGGNELQQGVDGDSRTVINLYKWQEGFKERAYFLKSAIEIEDSIPATSVIKTTTNPRGVNNKYPGNDDPPIPSKTLAEKFRPDGTLDSTTWGSGDGFIDPDSLAIWQGSPQNEEDAILLTKLTIECENGHNFESITHLENLLETYHYFADGIENANFPGVGWQFYLQMPAGGKNERISLVEFNTRSLVYNEADGQGLHFASLGLNSPSFKVGDAQPAQPEILSNYKEIFSFDINGSVFAFNTTNNDWSPKQPKAYPNFYKVPEDYSTASLEDLPIVTPAFNAELDLDDRALKLGFTPNTAVSGAIFVASANPDLLDLQNSPIKSSSGQERIGFFSEATDSSAAPYTGKFSASKKAILFEAPSAKLLSLIEYRHANLNHYLHVPNYAIGNSYATTQVARHRSWGRVQSISWNPTSDKGLDNLIQNQANRNKAKNYFVGLYPMLSSNDAEVMFIQTYMPNHEIAPWDWGANFNHGYAPFRSDSNHQNTTVDHSFYLNRSLLDGFFLSGSQTTEDYTKEENAMIGQRYRPFLWDPSGTQPLNIANHTGAVGNHRMVGYFRGGQWKDRLISYGSQSKEKGYSDKYDEDFSYHTTSASLLLDGAFNINSTSVDSWIAQLSSLRGAAVANAGVPASQTPVPRFTGESEFNSWNKLRTLSDDEVEKLAKAMVKQVKIRGPFLSFSDFVNRRLALGPMDIDPSKSKGTRVNFVQLNLGQWNNYGEDKYSAQGLRGAVQSAIAEAGLNDDGTWVTSSWIPELPAKRYEGNLFYDSSFGLHAAAIQSPLKNPLLGWELGNYREFGSGKKTEIHDVTAMAEDGVVDFRAHFHKYDSTQFGEAPENLLAVEHLATGANKPGWVMQSDVLSPLAPVSSARSDTFTIRVMGEANSASSSKAWIELVVQRTPDYVKADLDAPHHRPHEPFKDVNLNGYWDNGKGEHWLDLNRNGDIFSQPDLPGVGELGKEKDYRDGLLSDLKLNMDPQEEDTSALNKISYAGINQRFGRKFRIVRFRWLRANEV